MRLSEAHYLFFEMFTFQSHSVNAILRFQFIFTFGIQAQLVCQTNDCTVNDSNGGVIVKRMLKNALLHK